MVYQYDELNRLIHAETTGPAWGLSFSYDGFGNRTAQTVTKGTAPSWNELVDSATNRLVANYYNRFDANGNQTRVPWPGYGYATLYYDELNRLVKVDSPDGKEYYEYSPSGDRVWRKREAEPPRVSLRLNCATQGSFSAVPGGSSYIIASNPAAGVAARHHRPRPRAELSTLRRDSPASPGRSR